MSRRHRVRFVDASEAAKQQLELANDQRFTKVQQDVEPRRFSAAIVGTVETGVRLRDIHSAQEVEQVVKSPEEKLADQYYPLHLQRQAKEKREREEKASRSCA